MKNQGIIKQKERIKEILKLPSQDFITVEYMSGERKVLELKNNKIN